MVKGNQFGIKLDGRSALDLGPPFMQGLGNLYDWRAKVYEETIYKGVGTDLHKSKALQQGLDAIKTAQLRSLRLTAFKFAAQVASVFGTTLTIAGTGAGVLAATTSAAAATFWTTVGVSLGLVGAFITIVATVAVLVLEEEKWKDWLRDSPLSLKRSGQKPLHDDLADTLQQLANAQGELQPG